MQKRTNFFSILDSHVLRDLCLVVLGFHSCLELLDAVISKSLLFLAFVDFCAQIDLALMS